MAMNIRQSKLVQGIHVKGNEITITQMADDTTLFLKNLNSLQAAFNILDHYHKCAGLRLNKDKTEAILLGQDQQNVDLKPYKIKVKEGPFKILGIFISKDPNETISLNFNEAK